MNLVPHLSCFVAVAEELHFGRAAERLGMAQPPLSQRIQRLERELGVRLFERSSRRVELTGPGRLLLDEARDILARVDRVYALADRAEGAPLRAGLPAGLGGDVVAALIAAFRERRPEHRLEIRDLSTAAQGAALAAGDLDVGIVRHPCPVRGLAFGPVLGERFGVLLPAGEAAGPVALAALAGRDLVVFPREEAPGAFDELLAACRRHGYDPPSVREAGQPQFALGLVLAGTAVALTPPVPDAPGASWHPITGDPIMWRTSCAWRAGPVPGAVADFAAAAAAVLRREARMVPLDAAPRRVAPRPSSGFLA
ncbi:LysR substrate-binding domain-containing protein [Actinomadura parmotrematis]|uniref:LysR substrate-binding domain-containing protein n=1 Tax=Actinomadura parmotrematis TaxID=2864039 RepID=UPI00215D909E|nr:LysR substrate-binding domain-containing protein [Actinomadura parmotrematis]